MTLTKHPVNVPAHEVRPGDELETPTRQVVTANERGANGQQYVTTGTGDTFQVRELDPTQTITVWR